MAFKDRIVSLVRPVVEPFTGVADVDVRLAALSAQLDVVRGELDALRSRADLGDALVAQFQRERGTPAYQAAFTRSNPLVSVCVGTYNRAELVTERCVRSILAQDHHNLQVIVIGDACTDDTAERLARIGDSRLHFENLPTRGSYPDVPRWRWMVAGTVPFNRALELAEGDFITHLDDDDAFVADRVSKLVAFMQARRLDLAWHPFWVEAEDDRWHLIEARTFTSGQISTSSVMYHRWLKRIGWDLDAYKLREPGDANRFRKLRYLEPQMGRHPDALLWHYRQQTQART